MTSVTGRPAGIRSGSGENEYSSSVTSMRTASSWPAASTNGDAAYPKKTNTATDATPITARVARRTPRIGLSCRMRVYLRHGC